MIILPQSFYLDPYIPELSNLWFHKKNTQPTKQTNRGKISMEKTGQSGIFFPVTEHS